MKNTDLKKEYDLNSLGKGVRGKYLDRYNQGTNVVHYITKAISHETFGNTVPGTCSYNIGVGSLHFFRSA